MEVDGPEAGERLACGRMAPTCAPHQAPCMCDSPLAPRPAACPGRPAPGAAQPLPGARSLGARPQLARRPPPSPPNALRSRHADAVGADKPSKRWHSQDELRSRVLLERERARSSTPQGSARAHTPIGYQGRLVVGVPALPCPGHRLCWAVAGCFSPLHERSLAPWQPRGLPTALTMASASMLVFAWLSLCRSAPTAGRTSALSGVPTRDPGSSSATHAAYTTHPTRRHGAR